MAGGLYLLLRKRGRFLVWVSNPKPRTSNISSPVLSLQIYSTGTPRSLRIETFHEIRRYFVAKILHQLGKEQRVDFTDVLFTGSSGSKRQLAERSGSVTPLVRERSKVRIFRAAPFPRSMILLKLPRAEVPGACNYAWRLKIVFLADGRPETWAENVE
jgi:hypothetical protein